MFLRKLGRTEAAKVLRQKDRREPCRHMKWQGVLEVARRGRAHPTIAAAAAAAAAAGVCAEKQI